MIERDPIARPSHYAGTYGLECIEAIKNMLTAEEFRGFLRGNQIKYLWRYNRKNGLEDLRKAHQLGAWLLEDVANGNRPAGADRPNDRNANDLRENQVDGPGDEPGGGPVS